MSVATLVDGVLKREYSTAQWVPLYVAVVSVAGFYTAVLAVTSYMGHWSTLLLFAAIAAVAELANVKLFAKSRSTIAMSFVVAMAALVTLGPWAGILTHIASGAATVIPTYLARKTLPRQKTGAKYLLKKAAINMGMGALSAACGGYVYLWLGGIPGTIQWSLVFPLSFAVVADTVVNMGLLITVISLETGRKPLKIWVEDWQWAMPITISSGIIGGSVLAVAYEVAGILGLTIFILPLIATSYAFHLYLDNLRSYVDQLEVANQQLDATNLNLLHTLGAVIDAYDCYTFGHSAQVARYAGAIAEEMQLSPEEQMNIVRGALIHDIGKVGVNDAIVGKPGRLTAEEYEMMKLHTVIGAEIVSQMPMLRHLVPLVRSHHERWDGRGYPDGLHGEECALSARILAVADSVEVMLSDRPYQTARSLEEVVEEVLRCSGQQYDPAVVAAFVSVAMTRGKGFFINSATKVTQELQVGELLTTPCKAGYAKKSTAYLNLQSSN
ncbi:MAG: HD-GYP domain-containing protein [Caldilineaceae bacterium]